MNIVARLQERGIDPSDIKRCIKTGEIIEQYPIDYPFPSCLVLGISTKDIYIHTVVGIGNGYAWLITAHYPDKSKWGNDLRTRKGE